MFWGGLLVLAGLLLLLSNLGIIRVDVWSLFWPLFLIGLGVWLLWGVLVSPEQIPVEEASIPLQGAARATVRINHGAGQLRVGAGAAPGVLLAGRFSGGVKQDSRLQGDLLDVDLSVPTQVYPRLAVPWLWTGPRGLLDWELALNPEVPLALEVRTGASSTRLDLSELNVTDLRLDTGASSTEVTLPAAAGHTRASVRSGAASTVVRIPEGVAARIQTSAGLAEINVAHRFQRVSAGTYESPDYAMAPNRVDLTVETGVGEVSIR